MYSQGSEQSCGRRSLGPTQATCWELQEGAETSNPIQGESSSGHSCPHGVFLTENEPPGSLVRSTAALLTSPSDCAAPLSWFSQLLVAAPCCTGPLLAPWLRPPVSWLLAGAPLAPGWDLLSFLLGNTSFLQYVSCLQTGSPELS